MRITRRHLLALSAATAAVGAIGSGGIALRWWDQPAQAPMHTLSGEEAAKVNSDGKIPVHAEWQSRVKAGTASWDGMLTAAALASFTKDQNALDARISGLL